MSQKTFYTLLRLAACLLAAFIAARVLIPLAYEQRGYFAIGGEYLAVALVFAGVWYFMKLIDAARRKDCQQEADTGDKDEGKSEENVNEADENETDAQTS